MIETPTFDAGTCGSMVTQCRRKMRDLDSGRITLDEAIYNVVVILVHAASQEPKLRACWDACLDLFAAERLAAFDEWLHRELASAGYLYCSAAFLPDLSDPAIVEAKKNQLRPHLGMLHDIVRKRLAR